MAVGFGELELHEVIAKGLLDFEAWISLISKIEETYPDDREKICLVYDSFLSEFPLCYGYWRKYADHKARLCNVDKVVEVFERAVQSATYSVGVWVDYCNFSMSVFEDPFDVRRLFKRGMSFVGKDYLCHTLWDKYIEFEFTQRQWSSLAHIYIQTLRFPSKKLHQYYDRFKKLAAIWEEEVGCQNNNAMEVLSETVLDGEVTPSYEDDEISRVIKDLQDQSVCSLRSKALHKYLSIGERFYQESCQLDAKIHWFEAHIRRPYFHVKQLDVCQLENWHHYLDFVEMQGDFDWAVKLYERCLIPCANYPEFWMRYVEFMDIKGGREIANFALERATQIFLKSVPVIHLFNARFKEQIGDVLGAHAAFLQCDTESDSNFVENVIKEANMEKRMGNFVAASNIYKEALEMAAEKEKLHTLPILYVHFSRLKYMITGSEDAARDVLIDGIKHVPHCKLLLEELIKFTMLHGGPRDMNVVDSIISNAISPGPDISQGLSAKDAEDISSLYIEFVDLCGTIHDVRKAWNQHTKLFPHSLRTTSSYKHPAMGTKHLKTALEGKQDNLVAMPHHLSGDCSSDHPVHLQIQNQSLSLPEDHDILSDQAITEQLQSEANNSVQERLQQLSPKVSEQSGEDAPEQNVLTLDLVHRVANDTESIQPSQDYSRANDFQEHDRESELDLKPLSLESLSLNARENESPDSIPSTSHECEAPQETCMSSGSVLGSDGNTNGNPSISSPTGTLSADSTQIQIESVSPLPLASRQNPIPTQVHSQKQVSANSGGRQHQMSNTNKARRDAGSGFRKHSKEQQHQRWHISPQKKHPRAEIGAQMLTSQGYPCQPTSSQNPRVQQGSQAQNQYQAAAAQGNLTAAHAWPIQNVQQQSFASVSQSQLPAQTATYSQAQTSPYPMQSNAQYGLMQNSQAYDQMWHYYYYQQQQFLLQQQQQYQQQQPVQLQHLQQQQEQQQPNQQQLLQEHYQQQQLQLQQQYLQQQQPQQQQQQPPYQHQQLQQQQQQLQLQQQQYYLQQQQELQQQQPYQQLQLQQQQHLLHLQQQQQLQLQEQHQQSQQQPQLQQQQHQQQPQLIQQQQHLLHMQQQQYQQLQQQHLQEEHQQSQEQQQEQQQHQQQHLQEEYQQSQQQQHEQKQHQQQHLQEEHQQQQEQQQHQQPAPQQQQQQLEEQQQQPQHQQEEQKEQHQQQQITPSQIQIWNNSYYQQQISSQTYGSSLYAVESGQQIMGSQGQGITPPHSTVASGADASPHSQQQSPKNQ